FDRVERQAELRRDLFGRQRLFGAGEHAEEDAGANARALHEELLVAGFWVGRQVLPGDGCRGFHGRILSHLSFGTNSRTICLWRRRPTSGAGHAGARVRPQPAGGDGAEPGGAGTSRGGDSASGGGVEESG